MTIFAEKLNQLPLTVKAALEADTASLTHALVTCNGQTVVAIGSGGSIVSAEFLAACRTGAGQGPTLVTTPTGFAADVSRHWPMPVWLFSAGGSNPDIVAAFEAAGRIGAPAIHIVSTDADSIIARRAAEHPSGHTHVVPVAEPKDGFLATHSLIAATIMMVRAFDAVVQGDPTGNRRARIIEATTRILSPGYRKNVQDETESVFQRDVLLLLHDPLLTAAAVLIETSFWEVGLAAVQRTDFRNFAHGRHFWLARHGQRTGILALTADRTLELWRAISGLIPSSICRCTCHFEQAGRQSLMEALLKGLVFVEAAGVHRGIDPGRPGVPQFGRQIFQLPDLLTDVEWDDPAIRRKRAAQARADKESNASIDWHAARARFIDGLKGIDHRAVVLDYDGTVVHTGERLKPPRELIIQRILSLLDNGVLVAFATGRGGSLGETLRPILPERHWDTVLIGYYNGGYVTTLRTNLEASTPRAHPELVQIDLWLQARRDLFRSEASHKFSSVQITLNLADLADPDHLAQLIFAEGFGIGTTLILHRSGHSIDICPVTSSKLRVVEAVQRKLGDPKSPVLCIGDSGAWPGNDYDLLSGSFSLSVSSVCNRPTSCWNLLPEGLSGPDGLATILSALKVVSFGRARLDTESLLADPK